MPNDHEIFDVYQIPQGEIVTPGWYWSCQADDVPHGPFPTEQEAERDLAEKGKDDDR